MFRKKKQLVKTETITKELITKYVSAFMPSAGLSGEEQSALFEIARSFNLNPFKREIYCVPYMSNVKQPDGSWGKERKLSIITGYQVYLQRAEETGLLEHWKVWADDTRAYIHIKRRDRVEPFEYDIRISEYDMSNSMWKNKRETMAKKVVIGQGFRFAFPKALGSMPYTQEELPENMTNVTPKPDPLKALDLSLDKALKGPSQITEEMIQAEKTFNAHIDTVLEKTPLRVIETPSENIQPKLPKDEDLTPRNQSESTFRGFPDIVKLVNDDTVPNEHKILVMTKANGNKGNLDALMEIYKAIKENDYGRIAEL